jgi:hypothetical protein
MMMPLSHMVTSFTVNSCGHSDLEVIHSHASALLSAEQFNIAQRIASLFACARAIQACGMQMQGLVAERASLRQSAAALMLQSVAEYSCAIEPSA